MTRWQHGKAEIEQLLAAGDLQRVRGGQMNGNQLLTRAKRTIQTAASIVDTDPESAYVLAYDATRYACTALLAQQGLRPTSSGGHYTVERAVRAQFGDHFRSYGPLRRRRHELEYPSVAEEHLDGHEANDAISSAQDLIDAATRLLEALLPF